MKTFGGVKNRAFNYFSSYSTRSVSHTTLTKQPVITTNLTYNSITNLISKLNENSIFNRKHFFGFLKKNLLEKYFRSDKMRKFNLLIFVCLLCVNFHENIVIKISVSKTNTFGKLKEYNCRLNTDTIINSIFERVDVQM